MIVCGGGDVVWLWPVVCALRIGWMDELCGLVVDGWMIKAKKKKNTKKKGYGYGNI